MSFRTLTLRTDRFDPLAALQAMPGAPGLLESQNPNPKTARCSLLALRKTESFRLDDQGLARIANGREELLTGPPLETLACVWQARRAGGGALFPGGFFGYFAYDLKNRFEHLPSRALRDLPIAQLWLDWVDLAAVYDHQEQTLTVGSLAPEDDLQSLAKNLVAAGRASTPEGQEPAGISLKADLDSEQFCAMVSRAREYIAAGDIYQANLSCRFSGRFQGRGEDLYRRLRRINPSPFACLLRTPQVEIISASPERLVSLRGNLAETRPIAGTCRRGDDPAEDAELMRALLAHPKERAEHIMLVDLERNDLGKVCTTGSVEVDELMALEHYSHVTHIVSNVRGRLRPDCGPFDLLRATFPGGTITGVPKKRCMEIIDELEPTARGIYTGSAGYLSVTGNMDLNILIRSFQKCGDHLSFQVGAGIVADSQPEREWHECLAKGAALLQAAGG